MAVYQDEKTKKWFVRVSYKDYSGTHKQKYKGGFQLKRDALKWEENFKANIAGQPNMPFTVLCDKYLEDQKQHKKAATYATRKNRINTWIRPAFKDRPINEITPADIRAWQSDLKNGVCKLRNGSGEENENGKKLAPGYMQNLVTECSSVFNYAVKFFQLPQNPCTVAGNAVGKKQKSITYWEEEEFNSFISTFDKSDPYYTIYMILYWTGMRVGELLALRKSDINLKSGYIHIDETYAIIEGEEVVNDPKTDTGTRDIGITTNIKEVLTDYIGRLYGVRASDRIFTQSRTNIARIMNEHADAAKVKRIRVHDLRHSHASLLINMDIDVLTISERLGHKNPSVTLNVYSHLFKKKKKFLVERLEDHIKKKEEK